MAQPRNRYRQLEQYMSLALIVDAALFILYMIIAGAGIVWLKVFIAVLCFIISALCLVALFLTQEILRPRSLWMTAAAGAIVLVLIFSLILKYPSPSPRSLPTPGPVQESSQSAES